MNDVEDMQDLLSYLVDDVMPELNEYGLESQELTVYHDIISEIWKNIVRNMVHLNIKIQILDGDINGFLDRGKKIERFETWDN